MRLYLGILVFSLLCCANTAAQIQSHWYVTDKYAVQQALIVTPEGEDMMIVHTTQGTEAQLSIDGVPSTSSLISKRLLQIEFLEHLGDQRILLVDSAGVVLMLNTTGELIDSVGQINGTTIKDGVRVNDLVVVYGFDQNVATRHTIDVVSLQIDSQPFVEPFPMPVAVDVFPDNSTIEIYAQGDTIELLRRDVNDQVSWRITIDTLRRFISDVIVTRESDVVVIGGRTMTDLDYPRIQWISRYSENGDNDWTTFLEQPPIAPDEFRDFNEVVQLPDGRYAAIGSNGKEADDIDGILRVRVIDSLGRSGYDSWRTFTQDGTIHGNSIRVLENGEIVVSGTIGINNLLMNTERAVVGNLFNFTVSASEPLEPSPEMWPNPASTDLNFKWSTGTVDY